MSDGAASPAYPKQLAALAEFRFRLRMFLNFSETVSERCGIQAQQYQLMQVIASASADEQPSISYIAERMVLRHNSTVELVDRAERSGLVERHTDAKDLRRSIVRLTPHGETIFRRLLNEHLSEIQRTGDDLIAALQEVRNAEQA